MTASLPLPHVARVTWRQDDPMARGIPALLDALDEAEARVKELAAARHDP